MAPWYADKTRWQGRGAYLFMAVGACIKITAFSVGVWGGVETLLCLPHRLSDGNLLYIRLTYIMVILTTILVGARLGQLRRYGEEVALLDALPTYLLYRSSLLS